MRLGSAPSARDPHALVLLPTGNGRRLERLAGTHDADLLRLPRHRPPGSLRLRHQPRSWPPARRRLACRCDGLAASHPALPATHATTHVRRPGDRVVAPSSCRAACGLRTTGATSASTGRAAAPMSDAVAAGFHERNSARCRWVRTAVRCPLGCCITTHGSGVSICDGTTRVRSGPKSQLDGTRHAPERRITIRLPPVSS